MRLDRAQDNMGINHQALKDVTFYRKINNESDASKRVACPLTIVGAWTFIEVAWDYTAFGTKIIQNGQACDPVSFAPKYEWVGAYDTVCIGGFDSRSVSYFDNVMISNDPNRDLYALALLEACPRV